MRLIKKNMIKAASLMIALGMMTGIYSDSFIIAPFSYEVDALEACKITSMSATQGPEITVGVTGGTGFTFPVFNNNDSVKFEQVADDLRIFVKMSSDSDWVGIDNNAASGWIYDSNFGHFWDGPGGYWFHVTETTYVRLQSVSSPDVHLDYTLIYNKPERTGFVLSAPGDTALDADKNGAVGLVLPKIDGTYPLNTELDSFVYDVLVDRKWIPIDDPKSGFSYRSNGYSFAVSQNQWGYWEDTIYGLWFQPVTEDVSIRVGYPTDGVKGHDCGNNYVNYTIKGNPDAPRPNASDAEPVSIGSVSDPDIDGWNMIWNDEFSGNSIDSSKWSHETGYYINEDPGTWGWGNNELEYYTDSSENSFVDEGKLTLRLINKPASFEQDPNRIAPYSSGKLVSKDKFSFKYGRIDFCAKLPTGTGIWPALWMLPNDSVYGVWASSGEIDVMEAKGRLDNTIFGTIHYGGTWPGNRNVGNEFVFDEGNSYDDGFHVYSCIWEKDKIRWYVDGKCYSVIPYTEWYSESAPDNPYAPFDKEFYIIMNLAAGGNFDGGKVPDKSSVPSQMQVEYVRVYQTKGDSSGSYTDNSDSVGKIDAAYILRLQSYLLGKTTVGSDLDFDRNGRVNLIDMIKAKASLIEGT